MPACYSIEQGARNGPKWRFQIWWRGLPYCNDPTLFDTVRTSILVLGF